MKHVFCFANLYRNSPWKETLERVRVDFGVGIVHLGRVPAEAEDVLAEAQRLADAARAMRSRAAVADPLTGEAVAAEQAQWKGGRPRLQLLRPAPRVQRTAG
jgi:hypothetical protein